MDATTTTTAAGLAESAPVGDGGSPLTMTPKAVEMVLAAMRQDNLEGYGIRVGVVGGGCSGFQYSMDFENEQKDGDTVFQLDGIKLYLDPMSSMYLQGVTIDYVVGLQGAGFKFINPNARNTCGCGQSFST